MLSKMVMPWTTLQASPFCVVDSVSEPWGVYDAESQFDSFLLNANGVFQDVHCLVDPFYRRTQHRCNVTEATQATVSHTQHRQWQHHILAAEK